MVVKPTSLLYTPTVRAQPTAMLLDVAKEVNYGTYLPTTAFPCALVVTTGIFAISIPVGIVVS